MWLTSSQRQILLGLLSTDKSVAISEISAALGMSPGAVRRQLPAMRAWLAKHNADLVRQSDHTWIVQPAEESKSTHINRRLLIEQLASEEAPASTLGRKERIELLTFLIHVSSQPRIVQDFQNELQVSRSTILEDLDVVAEWYEARNLFLVRRTNYGIKLMGKESDWRKTFVELICLHLDDAALFHYCVAGGSKTNPISPVNPPLSRLINSTLRSLELPAARELVQLAETRLKTRFVDLDHLTLSLHIALLINRFPQGYTGEMNPAQIQTLMGQPAYRVALDLGQIIKKKWGFAISQSEVSLLTIQLLGAKLDSRSVGEMPPESEMLARSVLRRAAEKLKRPLDQDRELLIRLTSHLAPTIQRLIRDLPIRNPLLDDIRRRYPEVYSTARESCSDLQEYIGREVPPDEIAYITMYLAGAMMKYEDMPQVRALIVCPSGSATSWLLHSRLKKEFNNIQVVEILSTRDLRRGLPENVDLIISTVPIQSVNVPVIEVNALLSADDIRRIRESMEAMVV